MPLRLRRSHVESQLSCGSAPFHLFNLALLPKKDVLCTLSHFIAVQCTRANAFLSPLENSPQVLWFVLCVANTNSHNDTKAKLALIMGGTIIHEHYNELLSFLPRPCSCSRARRRPCRHTALFHCSISNLWHGQHTLLQGNPFVDC